MDERHYYAGMFDGESASEALERIDRWERSMADRAEQAQTLARRAGSKRLALARDDSEPNERW